MPPTRPIGYHITMRLQDDRPIAMTPAARRKLACVVLSQGRTRGLLAFGAADNHLHVELATTREKAGAFCRYAGCALRVGLQLTARFERARIRPLEDQRHAYHAFHYALRQDARHGLEQDLAREATSLPDLLGLRVVDASVARRVRAYLPRLELADLAKMLPPSVLEPVEADVDVDLLADAAAAAFALEDLRGRSAAAVHAKRAAIHAAGRGPARWIGDALGLSPRAVQLIRQLPPDARAVEAVRRQARLRDALGRAVP